MSESLESVEIENFTSIRHVRLDLTSDVTVLVGANGAGKSNVIQAFELLGRIVDRQLQERMIVLGGFSSVLNARASGDSVRLTAWGPGRANGYEASLAHAGQDEVMLVEQVMFWDRRYPARTTEALVRVSRVGWRRPPRTPRARPKALRDRSYLSSRDVVCSTSTTRALTPR